MTPACRTPAVAPLAARLGTPVSTRDLLTFAPVRARYVGLRISDASNGTPPILEEPTVPGH